jgi:hypothetical protein
MLVLASAVILRSESHGTHDHILLSQIRDSPNLEGQVPVFISPKTWWPSYTPRHWVPFSSPPTTHRATVEVFDPASTRDSLTTQNQSSELVVQTLLVITSRHGPGRKHPVYIVVDQLLQLPSNGNVETASAWTTKKTQFFYRCVRVCYGRYLATTYCLQSHRLETGLYATVLTFTFKTMHSLLIKYEMPGTCYAQQNVLLCKGCKENSMATAT